MSWRKHFRIVPSQGGYNISQGSSSVDEKASAGTSSKYASYLPEVYAGHPNRIQRYYQYEDMDRDSDINAALDTIADFCTQSEEQNDEPFEIMYNDEANETEVTLIKTNLKLWIKLNDFKQRLWHIFRQTIKNGDQFFLRDPETAEWLWIDHFMVELVKVDETRGKEADEYIIRGIDLNRQAKFATRSADPSQYRTPFGTSLVPGSRPQTNPGGAGTANNVFQMSGANRDPRAQAGGHTANELSVVDADHVIHLSLSVGMDINWPFGQSILEPIFKTYKQKELLEDSIIIYRVQRAPERRIFYIDVGTMPPIRAKAHIEMIKNEIHQRRIPNRTGGGSSIMDAAYNPLSIVEDYFFAQCLNLSTQVPVLDGRILSLRELIDEYEAGKVNYVYSLDTNTHKFEVGRVSWAGITRKNAQMVRVTLDNGEYIDATPDHRFILRDGSEVEAQYLTTGTSLMPLYLFDSKTGPNQKVSKYVRYLCNATGKKRFVHTDVCPKPKGREYVVHHKDFDSTNNNPDNLEVMSWKDHEELHKSAGTYSLSRQWNDPESRAKLISGMKSLYANRSDEFNIKLSKRNAINGYVTWNKPESAQKALSALKVNSKKQAAERKLVYNIDMFDRLTELYNEGYNSISKLIPVLKIDDIFQTRFKEVNKNRKRGSKDGKLGNFISDKTLNETVKVAGYNSWNDFKESYKKNHKVISVELLPYREDTGDITVESESDSHVFALAAGVYVHNSAEGRGSKVETLPGGDNLGEIGDLTFFTKKMARGLRIPSSYLSLGDDDGSGGASYNDGKLGAAVIQEFRFNKYCMRLQSLLAPVFDKDFKRFLKANGIEIESSLFELKFNPPQNFTKYRQIELDTQQVGVYQQVADNKKLSERFKLKRFLNLSEDEILENERQWAEENAAKLKKAVGSTPAESEPEGDLSSVGIRMPDAEMDMGDMEAPPEGEEGGEAPGGAQSADAGGAPPPPPPAGGQPPL
jgi:hypothetical protein